MTQPITIWVTPPGPNPWKVVQVAEELKVPYTIKSIAFQDTKFEPYIKISANGRVPAIEDPNTGVTIWESGAIILYLIEQYDTSHKLTYTGVKEKAQLYQWLMFQMSGQGPYYGQAAWFVNFHPEKVASVQDRYKKEMHRVLSVLETSLKANGTGWLVGDKMTYADLSYVWWNEMTQIATGEPTAPIESYPTVLAWHNKMKELPSFAKCGELRAAKMKEQSLGATGLKEGQTAQDLEADVEKQKQATAGN